MKILIVPTELAGHVNAGIGLAITLRNRGHQVKYVVNSAHKDIISSQGFDTFVIDYYGDENKQDDFEVGFRALQFTIIYLNLPLLPLFPYDVRTNND